MTVTIRPAEREEMAEFSRVVSQSLAMDAGAFDTMRPEWTLCAFEDNRLATAYAAWPFTMQLNGGSAPVAAVTTVSTRPVDRRRGHLRAIMSADFQRLHDGGGPAIAALYASMAAIYQRYGYGVVSTHAAYLVEPRHIAFSQPMLVRGALRELSRDDQPLLNDIYKRFVAARTGYLHRPRGMWAAGPLAPAKAGETLSLLVYEEDGAPLGYVIYTTRQDDTVPEPGPSQKLAIRDLAWLSPAAYRAIWEHLGRFDLVREIVWPFAPTDDPLPHLVLEPRMLRTTLRDGILARVVDVARALPSRHYVGSGRLTFEVRDEMCPWNAGRWQLETDGAETRVQRATTDPSLTMPVSTLAMLLFGQVSASAAAAMGRLDAHEPAALDSWDALFRVRHRPFCANHF